LWKRSTFLAIQQSNAVTAFAYREEEIVLYATIAETDDVNSPKMAVKKFIASRMQRSTR
jgi:hypothetical protein